MLQVVKRCFSQSLNRMTIVLTGSEPMGVLRIERGAKALENTGKIIQTSSMYLHSQSNTMISAVELQCKDLTSVKAAASRINAAEPGKLHAFVCSSENTPDNPLLKEFCAKGFTEVLDTKVFTQVVPLENGRKFIPIMGDSRLTWLKIISQTKQNSEEDRLKSALECMDTLLSDKSSQFVVIQDDPSVKNMSEALRNLIGVISQRKHEFDGRALGLCTSDAEVAHFALTELGFDIIADPLASSSDYQMLDVMGRTGKTFCIQCPANQTTDACKKYFDTILKKGYENRMYKWNVIFDYGPEKMTMGETSIYTPALIEKGVYKRKGIEKVIKQISI